MMASKKRRAAEEDGPVQATTADECIMVIRESVFFYAPVETLYTLKLLKALGAASEFALRTCTWPSDARVYLYINSGGGCAFAGLSAMDHIRTNHVPVITIADGFVASAATFMLLGGYERKSMTNAKILIQQLSTAFWGKYVDLDEARNSEDLIESLGKVYAEYTNLRGKKLTSLLRKELHMNAIHSLECGFVDEIW